MPQAKMETAAQKYRRIKAEQEAKEPLHDVTCNCGMVWKCKRQALDFWISSGALPSDLAGTFLSLKKQGKLTEADIMTEMSEFQFVQSIEFKSKIVRHTAVEPSIVEHPTKDTEIGYDEVMRCCYQTLETWQLRGGDAAAGLGTFPEE